MTVGSLFSGIGGLDLGVERAGWGNTLWQVEINPFARRVLAKHWPKAKQHEDVCSVGRDTLERVDLIVGGFPCQDVSSAGKGAGLAGARSGLWREFRRILEELEPPYAIVENVASGARRWLPYVRRDLHLLGYRTRAVALSAFDVGAPHLRRRVFVLAADPKRVELRDESRWRGGPHREGAGEPANVGEAWALADADGEGELQPSWGESSRWRWSRDGDCGWTIESPVCGVAHGIPNRVDRLRCLGNAVVPDVAEVAASILRHETRPRPTSGDAGEEK